MELENKFGPLQATCSMFELTFASSWIDEDTTKQVFLATFDEYLKAQSRGSREHNNYSIIYNCTCSKKYLQLYKMGFRQIGSYTGRVGKVRILLLKLPTHKSFWERLFS